MPGASQRWGRYRRVRERLVCGAGCWSFGVRRCRCRVGVVRRHRFINDGDDLPAGFWLGVVHRLQKSGNLSHRGSADGSFQQLPARVAFRIRFGLCQGSTHCRAVCQRAALFAHLLHVARWILLSVCWSSHDIHSPPGVPCRICPALHGHASWVARASAYCQWPACKRTERRYALEAAGVLARRSGHGGAQVSAVVGSSERGRIIQRGRPTGASPALRGAARGKSMEDSARCRGPRPFPGR